MEIIRSRVAIRARTEKGGFYPKQFLVRRHAVMGDLLWGDFKLGPLIGLPGDWGLADVAAPGQDWETGA